MNEKTTTVANERLMRRRRAQQLMAGEVKRLLEEHTEAEGLTWKGSTVDLMEVLYYAFEEGCMADDYGVPASFMQIVRQACLLLHTKVPTNPYETARRGQQRKGVKHLSYLDRYLIMVEKKSKNVLWNSISDAIA